jgi:elongation of very long chain fatty acids protein 6
MSLRDLAHSFAQPEELDFLAPEYISWVGSTYYIPFMIVSVYLAFIYFGPLIMSNFLPFKLDVPLFFWNMSLSCFSFCGMVRTVPYLLDTLYTKGFVFSVCDDPTLTWFSGPTGFWCFAMLISKIPELFDTVFIVLRKKELMFLHWYHHVTVLLFCWNAYASVAGSGLYFMAMNYTVHCVMYGYYAAKALSLERFPKIPLLYEWLAFVQSKKFPSFLITLMQIVQMIIGTIICISGWYFRLSDGGLPSADGGGNTCFNNDTNLVLGALMYASYFYLFVEFFTKRKTKRSREPAAADGDAKADAVAETAVRGNRKASKKEL